MEKIICHPGMPKAASSTIQATLLERHKDQKKWELLQNPLRNKPANSSHLLSVWSMSEHSVSFLRKNPMDLEGLSAMFEAISQFVSSDKQLGVISGEGIWGFSDKDFARVKGVLPAKQVEIRVVLREPFAATSSFFQQHLRSGKSNFKIEPLLYSQNLAKFDGHEIAAFDFDTEASRHSSGQSFFTQSLFPELAIGFDAGLKNPSLSWPAVQFLYRLNRNLKATALSNGQEPPGRQTVLNRLFQLEGPKFLLHPEHVPRRLDQIAYVNDRFGFKWRESLNEKQSAEKRYRRFREFNEPVTKENFSMISEAIEPILEKLRSEQFRKTVKKTLRELRKQDR